MAAYTENYSLLKPDDTDFYNVEDFNENMDAIDTLLAENETAMTAVDEKIGTPDDTGTDTLFGLLRNGSGGSFIKSIQRVTAKGSITISKDVSINAVDTAKTFVIMERLQGALDGSSATSYTLNETSLHVEARVSDGTVMLGFWIIECN